MSKSFSFLLARLHCLFHLLYQETICGWQHWYYNKALLFGQWKQEPRECVKHFDNNEGYFYLQFGLVIDQSAKTIWMCLGTNTVTYHSLKSTWLAFPVKIFCIPDNGDVSLQHSFNPFFPPFPRLITPLLSVKSFLMYWNSDPKLCSNFWNSEPCICLHLGSLNQKMII